MLNSIIIAVVAVSAVWVYLDATKNKIGKIPDGKGMFNMSAGAWCAVTLGLWIIGFPAYLINRDSRPHHLFGLPPRVGQYPLHLTWVPDHLSVLPLCRFCWWQRY